ncbi:psbP domain-containing protein 4, chloroplastic-like isoform X2 [Durio zibethinus]|uniref:PsbP domain-containing protein 4, chloroplastic-like isoform X2 n=1 Tax=Durio zibethinus TaxID=66656 RepID=A0A6P6AT52_DURZI|nr:psbP domain-containing protein 4, chloroplastic-like isoform X2 [Durio zibethinus]
MGTTLFSGCSRFPWKCHQQVATSSSFAHSSPENGISRAKAVPGSRGNWLVDREKEESWGILSRRSILVSGISLASSAVLGFPGDGLAVVKQGLLAGRIPGLSEPDEQGWRTYRRPDDKSGGHGVGWSPIIPYAFSVPQDWEEVPVSIADLGGTEIDLRFASSKEGRLFVIVAPVLRFADNLGQNATIEKIGPPEKVINAFGPEVIGENVEGKVLSINTAEHDGRMYYQYELEPPHALITATAAGNRLYLFSVTGSGLQWKRHYKDLKRIAESFRVV